MEDIQFQIHHPYWVLDQFPTQSHLTFLTKMQFGVVGWSCQKILNLIKIILIIAI